METELSSEFEARVAKHAALADPLRLRIVDLLTFVDRRWGFPGICCLTTCKRLKVRAW